VPNNVNARIETGASVKKVRNGTQGLTREGKIGAGRPHPMRQPQQLFVGLRLGGAIDESLQFARLRPVIKHLKVR
jgi:hypothetical protein